MRIGVCERARQHEKAHICANDRGPGQTDRRDGRPERACAGRGVWARAAQPYRKPRNDGRKTRAGPDKTNVWTKTERLYRPLSVRMFQRTFDDRTHTGTKHTHRQAYKYTLANSTATYSMRRAKRRAVSGDEAAALLRQKQILRGDWKTPHHKMKLTFYGYRCVCERVHVLHTHTQTSTCSTAERVVPSQR